MLGHERLHEKRALLRVEPGRDPVGDHVVGVGDERRGVRVLARQRVPVGDEVEAVVLLLERHPVAERADEMAEMELAGRPHTRNDARAHGSRILIMKLVGGEMIALAAPVNISA